MLFTGAVGVAQVGRGWSDWPTPYADAQRTSWLRTDPKISVEALSKSGFDLQWTSKLDELGRKSQHLTQGVTVSGVTLFVPVSLIAGSNKLYMLDNDTGHIVWSRAFDKRRRRNGLVQWRHQLSADAHRERSRGADVGAACDGASGRRWQSAGLPQLGR